MDHLNIKEIIKTMCCGIKMFFIIVKKPGLIIAGLFRSCECRAGNKRVQEQATGGN